MNRNTGFRKPKKLSQREQAKAQEIYNKQLAAFKLKCAEYEPMTLKELQDLYNSNKKPGGTYLQALFYVTNQKLKAQENEKSAETSEVQPVVETIVETKEDTVDNNTEEKKEE